MPAEPVFHIDQECLMALGRLTDDPVNRAAGPKAHHIAIAGAVEIVCGLRAVSQLQLGMPQAYHRRAALLSVSQARRYASRAGTNCPAR